MTVQTDDPNELLEAQSEGTEQTELERDQVHHLLQNERRRNVLRYLESCEGPVQMRDIAEQVAAWEHDTTVQALMSDERQRVYIALYQAHLPKLADEGVIDYNQSRGIVEKKPLANQLIAHLHEPSDDETTERDDEHTNWGPYYLGVSGVSAALLAMTVFDVSVFGSVAPLLVAFLILSVYSSVTFAHVIRDLGRLT